MREKKEAGKLLRQTCTAMSTLTSATVLRNSKDKSFLEARDVCLQMFSDSAQTPVS